MFTFEKYHDLEAQVSSHLGSLEMTPSDRLYDFL